MSDNNAINLVLVNLMPTKEQTEIQFKRMLNIDDIKVNIELICAKSHTSKNTDNIYIENYYKSIYDIKDKKYDAMIITGAPVEHLEYEKVDYWNEMKDILEFSKYNVKSTMYICWGAQAALYHFYGLQKTKLDKKIFGVFKNYIIDKNCPLFDGLEDYFYAPHSRYTEVKLDAIKAVGELKLAALSDESGAHIVVSNDCKNIFVMGHSEYDINTLKNEYDRDVSKKISIEIPKNYFENDDSCNLPIDTWMDSGKIIFKNWIRNIIL